MARKRISASKRKGWLQQAKTGIRRFIFKSKRRVYKRRRKVMPRGQMKTRKYRYVATMRMNPSSTTFRVEVKNGNISSISPSHSTGRATLQYREWIGEPFTKWKAMASRNRLTLVETDDHYKDKIAYRYKQSSIRNNCGCKKRRK